MISNLEKKEFLQSILERLSENINDEDVAREIFKLLLSETNNGKMYKYRAFNEYSLSNLKEGTLYCAVPSSVNDPFDCKIGIDMQSSIEARFGKEFKNLEEYLGTFLQVLDNQNLVDVCTDREKQVFHRWCNSEHLCEFINKFRHADATYEDLMADFLSNSNLILELFGGFSPDSEFVKQLEKETELFSDFAKGLGVDEDADEIKLATVLHQKYKPEEFEIAQQVDDMYEKINVKLGKKIDEMFRIGCLCTDYKNRLMWSHYADSHRGFCIEFDFGKSCEMLKGLNILPVVYSKERVKFPWGVVFGMNEESKRKAICTIVLSFLTKDEVWNYENEWRIITSNNDKNGNIKMPPISCIYLGAMCSDEDKAKIIEIAKELNVQVKQMTVDRGEYTLHASNVWFGVNEKRLKNV